MSRREQNGEQGRENREWGQDAEQIAAEYLLKEGYTIRERNWRMGKYEIDLILEKDNTIVFVEVKARRGDNIAPVDAVDLRKQSAILSPRCTPEFSNMICSFSILRATSWYCKVMPL